MMGLLDGLLGKISEQVDVANLATKVGLSPEQAQGAVAALGQAHAAPGDTMALASQSTGLPTDKLQEIVGHIGGEGALGRFASMIDRDGDGNPLNDITGLVGGLFGKK
jgi:hypothetical protein